MSLAVLLALTAGAWAQDTYNVTFKANGNTVTKENVTLPYTFSCDYGDGELDQIIQELYELDGGWCDMYAPNSSGSENVTCGIDANNQFITVSAPFDGTATVTGRYCDAITGSFFDYSLEITCPQAASDEIEVTPVTGKTNEWTFQMPASNVEVEVEYFSETEAANITAAIAAINQIPNPLPQTLTLSTYEKVKAASTAYNALTDEEKAAVTNADKLTAAIEAFAPYESPAGTIYNSGSISLTALQPGDILMQGVSLTGEKNDKVGLQRLALDGEKKDGQFVLSFEYMTPLLGENAAVTSGSMVFTPIAEDGNAGDAWIVFDGSDIADATVWLNGINSASLPTIISQAQAAVEVIDAIPSPVAYDEASKNAIDAARAAVNALAENVSLIDEDDIAKLTQAEQDYADKEKEATTKYSTSVNIEQLTLVNGVKYDITKDFIDSYIEYASINALDTLNDLDNKAMRNEPYLGLKLKTAGAYIKVLVKKGSTLNVKFGAVKEALGVSINGTAQEAIAATDEGTTYSYEATDADAEVVFTTASNKTVVFKQIMIDEPLADITLPEPGAYLITVATPENGTAAVDWANKKYRTPVGAEVTVTATPAEGYELENIMVTGATSNTAYEVIDGKFTMPAEEVTVSASFKQITGIDGINADEAVKADGKYVENGKIVIYRNGAKYTVGGKKMK